MEEPSHYLRDQLCKRIIDGKEVWTVTSVDYIVTDIKTLEEYLNDTQWLSPFKVMTPMKIIY